MDTGNNNEFILESSSASTSKECHYEIKEIFPFVISKLLRTLNFSVFDRRFPGILTLYVFTITDLVIPSVEVQYVKESFVYGTKMEVLKISTKYIELCWKLRKEILNLIRPEV